MLSDTPPPLEMQLDALSAAYGLDAGAVLDLAVRNLSVLTAYQMGAEGAPAEQVFKLLLAPALSAPCAPQNAQEEATEAPTAPAVWPDPDQAPPKQRGILLAAARMVKPFTSREIVEKYGGSSASVGGILAAAGWPYEAAKVGGERRWLPRPS